MLKKLAAFGILIGILFGIYFFFTQKTAHNISATVGKVIDGDTLELVNGDKIRLIGVDAPEHDQPFFSEVTDELKKLEGKKVRLETDKINKDTYGRLLRYIFLGDRFVNLELVKNGLAFAYVVSPNDKYAEEIFAAENFARESRIGIWKRSEFADCINLKKFNYNAKGEDNKNLNGEYVIFENVCNATVDLENWTVSDSAKNIFTFPKNFISSSDSVTLFSGSGNDTRSEVYWKNEYPIWNNGGDSLQLRDSNGDLVIFQSYQSGK